MRSGRSDLILIIGVGRSGTSALTRVLSLSGCTLPETVSGATQTNPKGNWEPVEIWKLNHELMLRHDSEYTDPTLRLQEIVRDKHEAQNYIGKVQSFLARCPRGSALLIKQPDITEVLELWVEAAKREDFSVKVIIPVRSPREVYASISAASDAPGETVSVELSNAFWLKRNLLAERHSRDLPRVVVEYSNLMDNWRHEIARIAAALSIDLEPGETAVEGFLSRDLHRQKCCGPIDETFGYQWMTRVYAILSGAAKDLPIDLATLDEIYHAYRLNERSFRIALDEFRHNLGLLDRVQFRAGFEDVPVLKSGHDF